MDRTKTNVRLVMWITVVALASTLHACTMTPEMPGEDPGIANPASEYCVELGGDLDIREGPEGGQIGICVFPDGSECEEWALYNGECTPGQDP